MLMLQNIIKDVLRGDLIMNILISAYCCNPYNGSEDAVGWNWILQYSRNAGLEDKIYVITKSLNAESMRKGIAEYSLDNVELWFSEPPKFLDWYREKYSIFHHMYYELWQKWAYIFVKKKNIHFDIIHHVTMTDWRFVGYFSNFKDSYTIFGPVGGGQEIPAALKDYQTKRAMEMIRTIANRTRKYIPTYVKKLNAYDAIYAVNEETKEYVNKILKDTSKLYIEPDCAIAEPYRNLQLDEKKDYRKHKLLFSGRYDLPRKGAYFLIDSLSKLPKDFEFSLDMYGGPLDCSLKEYIEKCGLSESVHLKGRILYKDMKNIYSQYDAFVFPSLRETGGNVLFEAMACGLPVIGFSTSVNRILKEHECGVFVDPECNLNDLKMKYANAIIKIFDEKYYFRRNNAYKFANKSTWAEKYNRVVKNEKINTHFKEICHESKN